jgi:hypothetical protein
MREAGTIHTPTLISFQAAPLTSPDRAAQKIISSRARAAMPLRRRSSAMKTGTSFQGKAA